MASGQWEALVIKLVKLTHCVIVVIGWQTLGLGTQREGDRQTDRQTDRDVTSRKTGQM